MKKLLRILQSIKKYFLSQKFIFLKFFFGGFLLLYIILAIFVRPIETLITFPGKDINLKEITNHPAGIINAEFFDIPSSSGNNIHGLYIDNNAQKTVYYFHWNGAPMEYFYTEMRYIADLWYNLMTYDFPGYGKSEWEPTQLESSNFSLEFFKFMQKEKSIKNKDLIIWGYSIGTAVAIDFAKDVEFDKLVLFSPIASRYDMSEKFFWFPLQKLFFRKNSYVSKEVIKNISNPTLIIHGNKDIIVPFSQGKQVFNNSGSREKYFLEIDDFGHSLIIERYGDVLRQYILDFLQGNWLNEKQIFLDKSLASKLLKRYKEQNFLKGLDLKSDNSLTKYVDPDNPFIKKWYIPEDMRSLKSDYIIDTKWNAKMREIAATAFESMAQAFYNEFREKIVVVSTYRSYNYQAGIKSRWCPDNLCAKAWYSEHQSGLTADLWSASSQSYWNSSSRLMKYYLWLSENADKYGFHNTYQKWKKIDGYEVEPWHWRYLWPDLATYLKKQGITFAEFYKNKGE